MRTSLILVFFAALFQFTNKANSQTLQFSRVLLVSTTQTVPANKIWKIESFFPSQNFDLGNNNSSAWLSINNTSCFIGQHRSDAGMSFMPLPAWIPAGTTLAAGQNISSISVIEFTVLP
jgi:hypothetical protein